MRPDPEPAKIARRKRRGRQTHIDGSNVGTCSTVWNFFQRADGVVTESNTSTGRVYTTQHVEGVQGEKPAFILEKKRGVINSRDELAKRSCSGIAPASETATGR
jgi:hypothetical protein